MARVKESRTTDVTRVLKAPGAELYQNACDVVNEQKIFFSHQCSVECLMNKFRAYIYIYMCVVDINSKIRHLTFWYISVLYKYSLFANLLQSNNESKSVKAIYN